MSKTAKRQNLAKVKQALADKYSSLAKCAKSQSKRKEYSFNAEKYRNQAIILGSK